MCGIFGLAGKLGVAAHDKFLKDACQVGSLRGAHATGIIHAFYDVKNPDKVLCNTHKKAVPGWEYVHEKEAKILTTCSNTLAIIGHNRYATGGGMDDEHAHPFHRGPVSLVHNGVIDNWRELLQRAQIQPYKNNITVDSDSIAALLASTDDAKEILEQIDGAFAFVWHDERDHSINFARNSERPMHFLGGPEMFAFGSELGMLQWLAARNDVKVSTASELSVGAHVKFVHAGNGKLTYTTEKFSAKARSRTAWTYGASAYDTYDYNAGNSWHRRSQSTGAGTGTGATTPESSAQGSEQSRNSANRMNLDGLTYPRATTAIQQLLEVEGMVPGKMHDFTLDSIAQDTGRIILNLRSITCPNVRAVKYLYKPTGTVRNPGARDTTESELVDYILLNQTEIAAVSAQLTSIIMYTGTDGLTWEGRTVADTFEIGAYRYMIDTDSIVVHELNGAGAYVESFNFKQEMLRLENTVPKTGARCSVAGLNPKTLDNLYKGSPIVTCIGPSTDINCVIVAPERAPSTRLQVRRENLRVLEA